jgi:hypothetical protein
MELYNTRIMAEVNGIDLREYELIAPCSLQRDQPDCTVNRTGEHRKPPLTKTEITDPIERICGRCPVFISALTPVDRLRYFDRVW